MKKSIAIISVLSALTLAACGGTSIETVATNAIEPIAEKNENTDVLVLDKAQSVLNYTGRNFLTKSHSGTVPFSSGEVFLEDGEPSGGQFIIDMPQMTGDNEGLMAHLKNEDFFNVEKYPEARFEITEISKMDAPDADGNTHQVSGNLEIIGATNNISFPATINQGDSGYTATASFTIDRTDWGIEYNSQSVFSDLGDNAIRDEIEFELNISAK